MAINVTGFGTKVSLRASNTFPAPIIITEFSDDADPVEIEDLEIGQDQGGLQNAVQWQTYSPIHISLNIIAGGDDDELLQALFLANTPSPGRQIAKDVLTMSIIYPSGKIKTYANGFFMSGPAGLSVTTEKKLKTNLYKFGFESLVL